MAIKTTYDAKDDTIRVDDGLAWAKFDGQTREQVAVGANWCAPSAAQMIEFGVAAEAFTSPAPQPSVNLARARAYDNLQNEGYRRGQYNPYRESDDTAYRGGRNDGFDENDN